MGTVFPVRNRVVSTDASVTSNHSYIYPPNGGLNFFSSHYYLGSKKFETSDPESFLYGDLADLNQMTHDPRPFPYRQPPKKKPIDCLNALTFLHKETLKLVKLPENGHVTLQFKFDSLCDCSVYVICMASRLINMASLKNGTVSDSASWISQKYSFQKGLEQEFSESSLIIPLNEFEEEKLIKNSDFHSLVVLIETSTTDYDYQSLMTICELDKSEESGYSMKVLKQKFMIDGLEYIFHEIFGLENKAQENSNGGDNSDSGDDSDDEDDLGAECVICFTDVKDTIILPCRHFCLCASCAADLRYQASNCPICRAPFQALMQIQGVQKLLEEEQPDDDEVSNNPEIYSVPGYKLMSLLQALNGYPKIKKNTCQDSGPAILMSTSSGDEDEGHQTSITVDPPPNEVIISFEDDEVLEAKDSAKEITTSPLIDNRQQVLPDLIPPGSIPGTPEEQEEPVKPDSVAMVIEANIESHSNDDRKSCSSMERSTDSSDNLVNGSPSTASTLPTEMSSLKSSTSFDSAGSEDALIKGKQKHS